MTEPKEDRGAPKRVRERAIAATVLAIFLGGGAKGLSSVSAIETQGRETSVALQAQMRELGTRFDEQARALSQLQLTLVELKGGVAASRETADRLASEIAQLRAQAAEHARVSERSSARLDEHDRRLQALEQQRGSGSDRDRGSPR